MSIRAIVTGGAGFIGSHLVLNLIREQNASVLNIDKLTYCANLDYLSEVIGHSQYSFAQIDIADYSTLKKAIFDFKPDVIFHLAAESHVDRSIANAAPFITSNIIGTYNLLEVAREYNKEGPAHFRFIHVSTDEVYGSLDLHDAEFTEDSCYRPNSPYSASKASSDHLVRAWGKTYDLPVIISHSSNNYGPHQYPEKLIPRAIHAALVGDPIPIYGNGKQIRDWIHVRDHVEGLVAAFRSGSSSEVYNFGGRCERTNLEVVQQICRTLDKQLQPKVSFSQQISFVDDRKGHDFRYALSIQKTVNKLHWGPKTIFESGLEETILWYVSKLRRVC